MIKSYGFACFYQSVSPYATLTHVCNKALVKEGEERKMIKKKKTEDTHTHTHHQPHTKEISQLTVLNLQSSCTHDWGLGVLVFVPELLAGVAFVDCPWPVRGGEVTAMQVSGTAGLLFVVCLSVRW
jgi:hypothetical protein